MIEVKGISYLKNKVIGLIEIIEETDGISNINFLRTENYLYEEYKNKTKESPLTKKCREQLEEYFLFKRKEFNIKLDIVGTDFQIKTWKALLEIPYGSTISYQEQAEKIGNIKAVRAVGTANGKNKIPIIIPCHRVIGKSKKLVGYSGGLDIKQYLLEIENKL